MEYTWHLIPWQCKGKSCCQLQKKWPKQYVAFWMETNLSVDVDDLRQCSQPPLKWAIGTEWGWRWWRVPLGNEIWCPYARQQVKERRTWMSVPNMAMGRGNLDVYSITWSALSVLFSRGQTLGKCGWCPTKENWHGVLERTECSPWTYKLWIIVIRDADGYAEVWAHI